MQRSYCFSFRLAEKSTSIISPFRHQLIFSENIFFCICSCQIPSNTKSITQTRGKAEFPSAHIWIMSILCELFSVAQWHQASVFLLLPLFSLRFLKYLHFLCIVHLLFWNCPVPLSSAYAWPKWTQENLATTVTLAGNTPNTMGVILNGGCGGIIQLTFSLSFSLFGTNVLGGPFSIRARHLVHR